MVRRLLTAGILGAALAGATALPVLAQGLAGPYLAATAANADNDFKEAGRYYVQAMAADRENGFLRQSAMVAFVSAGDFSIAQNIAKAIEALEPDNVYADLVLTVERVNAGDYDGALAAFPPDDSQLSPMLWNLMRAWILLGQGDTAAALAGFDNMSQNETIALYGRYNKALALAYTGDMDGAAAILAGNGETPLHLNIGSIVAHVQILSELGRNTDALAVLDGAAKRGFRDARLQDLRAELEAGKSLRFTQVDDPSYGMAEALVTIAEALSRDTPNRLALFYARLAQQLRPDSVEATMLVGDILERTSQYALAEEAYAAVPRDSSEYKNANIGRAEVLRKKGDIAGATDILEALAKEFPQDINVLNALGDIYRGADNYKDAIQAYSLAIDLLENPPAGYWVLYYARGISYEQTDQWPEAEADLRRALELSPDQPQVLNYIGYSFLEMRENLDEAQKMIETAAARMPDNGYIIDSLGWMFYRLGKFEQAVAPMEKAVRLMPDDPIINDHFGDVLWKVGRKREAAFQWRRSLSFNPEPEDAARTLRKLEVGLDVVLEEEAAGR